MRKSKKEIFELEIKSSERVCFWIAQELSAEDIVKITKKVEDLIDNFIPDEKK